ncbi:MAG: polysaccharide deacetylase family protein [Saprospiraceae bacterium]|nr:polysaccharide deacetylase family protein [Saprospiraceae bacterium]
MHVRWLQKTAPALPFRLWQKWSGERLFLPFYHVVSDENPVHIRHLYPVRTVRQFEDDLDFLLKHFEPVSLERIFAYSFDNQIFTKPSFHLTFDDGLRECFDVIRPILLQKGIPATFFLNSAFVDNQDLMFRYKASLLAEVGQTLSLNCSYAERHKLDDLASACGLDFRAFLQQQKPYLTIAQIKKMRDEGFTFGAHSVDHPLLSALSKDEQMQQISQSMDFVKSAFNLDYQAFAFPFTDDGINPGQLFSEKTKTLSFGGAGLKADAAPHHLQRFAMERTSLPARAIVSAEFAYTCLRKMAGKHRVER